MKYLFTAVFTPSADGKKVLATVPDLPGCTTSGRDLQDAIDQITDAASGWLSVAEDEGLQIPPATTQDTLNADAGESLSLIQIDTLAYRAATDTRAVRKNVSLPAWLASLADKRGINCSQVLQEALVAKLTVAP